MARMFGVEHLSAIPPAVPTGLHRIPPQQGTWPPIPDGQDMGENEKTGRGRCFRKPADPIRLALHILTIRPLQSPPWQIAYDRNDPAIRWRHTSRWKELAQQVPGHPEQAT